MKKFILRYFVFCAVFSLLIGCAPTQDNTKQSESAALGMENVSDITLRKADSLDFAAIQKIDEQNRRITFYNYTKQKSYTLTYDNATSIKSRHEEELVVGQLAPGDLVEVTFIKGEKKIKNIWMDKSVTVTEAVTGFDMNRTARTFELNGEEYSIDPQAPVIAEGEILSLMDIHQVDTLKIAAVDRTIRSITIVNGHGYLRLIGAESFEGGWVELGQSIIQRVEKDMLLLVPAGSYEMLISNKGNVGTKSVVVTANEETQVDVSDLAKEADTEGKMGGIVFTILPVGATLKVDGQETDYSSVVSLSYGIHHIEVEKEGYNTISRYIKVGQEMANISIDMAKEDKNTGGNNAGEEQTTPEDDKGSVSDNSVIAPEESDIYKVYIDAPEKAELYVNGKYIGVIPTSFDKKKGTYTISVRQEGYKTRSYSLEVDDIEKDVRYSFSSLEKES